MPEWEIVAGRRRRGAIASSAIATGTRSPRIRLISAKSRVDRLERGPSLESAVAVETLDRTAWRKCRQRRAGCGSCGRTGRHRDRRARCRCFSQPSRGTTVKGVGPMVRIHGAGSKARRRIDFAIFPCAKHGYGYTGILRPYGQFCGFGHRRTPAREGIRNPRSPDAARD
jgi:hypothetical protein